MKTRNKNEHKKSGGDLIWAFCENGVYRCAPLHEVFAYYFFSKKEL